MGIDLSRGGREERGMGGRGGEDDEGRTEEEMRKGKGGEGRRRKKMGGEILLWNGTQSLELKWVQNPIGGRNSIFSQV